MSHAKQRGVALITVLLVVAMATLLVAAMMRSQHTAMQYAAGLFSQDQAWLYTQGAESFVTELLEEDSRRDQKEGRKVDHLGEVWARPFPTFPVDGGVVNARIADLQGRFNINRLWHDNAKDPAALAIFERLLKSLDLPDTLGGAVIDWIDADNEPESLDGAEDDYYSRLSPPYRVANRSLVDVSELRLIRGFTPEVFARLQPYICVLPAKALLNINTAPAEVLVALSPTLILRTAEELAKERPNKGYESVDEFLSQPVFNGLDNQQKTDLSKQLSVNSDFFELISDAEIAGRHSSVLAVLARDDSGTIRLVSRDLGKKLLPDTTTQTENNKASGEPLQQQDDDLMEQKLKAEAKKLL